MQALVADAGYHEGAFVGEHGSWDRGPVNANGRPVGLALDHSGALPIADDVGNTVWGVSAAGQH